MAMVQGVRSGPKCGLWTLVFTSMLTLTHTLTVTLTQTLTQNLAMTLALTTKHRLYIVALTFAHGLLASALLSWYPADP